MSSFSLLSTSCDSPFALRRPRVFTCRRPGFRRLGALLLVLAAAGSGTAEAQTPPVENAARRAPRIRPGAWEFALGASFTNINGTTQGSAEVRGGTFVPGGSGLVGFEALLGYAKFGDTDYGDAQLGVSWQRPVTLDFTGTGKGGVWPYVGLGGGVSQAWGPLYEDTRYPVGFSLGARFLQGRGSAARVEYRFRRYLDVHEGNYSQGGWFVGVSFFLNNPEKL